MAKNYDDQEFYLFGVKNSAAALSVTPDIFEEAVRTGNFSERRRIHNCLALGEYPDYLQFPVIFHKDEGVKLRDLASMAYGLAHFLISDRIRLILEENHLTGWKTYPIELYDKKGKEIWGYNGFSFVGRGGAIEGSMGPMWREIQHKRHRYDRTQWDGSDFFIIYPMYPVITERALNILCQNKISGAEFYPLSTEVDY